MIEVVNDAMGDINSDVNSLVTNSLVNGGLVEERTARVMVVWCPDWPVVAAGTELRLSDQAPVAVVQAGQVLSCSPAARVEGVRRGMRRRDASAHCPELVLVEANETRDVRAFETVLGAVEERERIGHPDPPWAVCPVGTSPLLRWRVRGGRRWSPSAWSRSGCGTVGSGSRKGCSPPSRRLVARHRKAGRSSRRVGRPSSWPSCRSAPWTTPTWSVCYAGWGCDGSAISPPCPSAT